MDRPPTPATSEPAERTEERTDGVANEEFASPGAEPAELSSDASSGGADHDDVARRAYRRYEARGHEHGRDVDDWLDAEREIDSGNVNSGHAD